MLLLYQSTQACSFCRALGVHPDESPFGTKTRGADGLVRGAGGMLEDEFALAEFASRVDEELGRGFGSGLRPERQPERFVARPVRGPGKNRLELAVS
jgi:hypothetical protein